MNDTRSETETEGYDRNMAELLQELRVALPGVQVLFAFLLTVPFATRFDGVSAFERNVYFVTLLCSALASAFFIAPTAYHRLNFRRGDKRHIVEVPSRFTVLGLVALFVAMLGAVVMVTSFLFGAQTMVVTALGVFAVFTSLWFVLPLLRRRHTSPARADEPQRVGATRGSAGSFAG